MKPSIRNLFFFFILYANSFWTQEPIYSYLDNSSYVYGNPAFADIVRCLEFSSNTIIQHNKREAYVSQSIAILGNLRCSKHSFGIIVGSNKIGRINQSEKYSGLYSLKFRARKLAFKIAGQVNYITQNSKLVEVNDLNSLNSITLVYPNNSIRNNYMALDLGLLVFSRYFFISAKFANINTPNEANVLGRKISKTIKSTLISSYIYKLKRISILPTVAFEYSEPKYYGDSLRNKYLPNNSNLQFNLKMKLKKIEFGVGYRKVLDGYNNLNLIMGYKGNNMKFIYNIGVSMVSNNQTLFHQFQFVSNFQCGRTCCKIRKIPNF